MSSRIDLVGKVDNALTKKNTFRLIQKGTGEKYTILVEGRPNFQEGDSIHCRCEELPSGDVWRLVSLIHIELGQDENTFISMIYRAIPGGGLVGKNAKALYEYFKTLLKSEGYREHQTPGDLVSFLSESYLRSPDKENSSSIRVLCEARTVIAGKRRAILTVEQAAEFLQWWAENFDMRRLYCLGLTFDEIDATETRPYKLYKRVLANPYTVPEISFDKCRMIDLKTGRIGDKSDDLCGNIVRTLLHNTAKRNYSCTPLVNIESNMCAVVSDKIKEILVNDFRCVFDDVPIYIDDDEGQGMTEEFETRVYLKRQFKAERGVVQYIVDRVTEQQDDLGEPIFDGEVELDEWQKSAVAMTLKNSLSILCGAAGSGKTRTLGEIIKNFEIRGRKIIVTSFTGKAVNRASELNGLGENAATTHRILYGSGPQEFDTVIFEESGMNDMVLLWKFIKQHGKRKFRAIFVGDPTQLLPIGWGTPFASMIASRSVPKVELKSNHRVQTSSGDQDGIIVNAQNIAHWPKGEEFVYTQTPNFRIHHSGIEKVFEIMEKAKADGKKCNQVTILCPQAKQRTGDKYFKQTRKINAYCSMLWHGGKPSVSEPERIDPDTQEQYIPLWREGDRVMVTSNVYDGVDIFNGQEGIITQIHPNAIEVGFSVKRVFKCVDDVIPKIPDPTNDAVKHVIESEKDVGKDLKAITYQKVVRFPFGGAKKKKKALRVNGGQGQGGVLSTLILELSYAITVHKSQGSEWDHVVFIVPPGIDKTGRFFNINMCYTAPTRAAKECDIIDPASRTNEAIAKRPPKRCDSFEYIIKHNLPRLQDYVSFTFERPEGDNDEADIDDDFFDDDSY